MRSVYLAPGVSIYMLDSAPFMGSGLFLIGSGEIVVDYGLSGYSQEEISGGTASIRPQRGCVVRSYPQGSRRQLKEASQSGRLQNIGIAYFPNALMEYLNISEVELPAQQRWILQEDLDSYHVYWSTLSQHTRSVLTSLWNPVVEGSLLMAWYKAQVTELFCDLVLSATTRNQAHSDDAPPAHALMQLEKAMAILEKKLAKPPTLVELAELIGSNKTTLSANFRKVLGVSVHEYSNEMRLTHAWQLLVNSDMTIGRIAVRVGFSNQSSFTQAFRRQFGCNPRDVRQGWRTTER